jgi:hypothetical protein
MATFASSSGVTDHHDREPGVLTGIWAYWSQFLARAFHPYRPELHYMRGPGPAWHAKHVASSHLHST